MPQRDDPVIRVMVEEEDRRIIDLVGRERKETPADKARREYWNKQAFYALLRGSAKRQEKLKRTKNA